MKYKFDKNYRINVEGTPEEIKFLIKELSNSIDKGTTYKILEEELSDLENIVEPTQYTFGIYHRIYYTNKSFLYVPNVSSKEAQKLHFGIFKKIFDDAIKRIEEMHKNNKK